MKIRVALFMWMLLTSFILTSLFYERSRGRQFEVGENQDKTKEERKISLNEEEFEELDKNIYCNEEVNKVQLQK